jgi:hypothetical protein
VNVSFKFVSALGVSVPSYCLLFLWNLFLIKLPLLSTWKALIPTLISVGLILDLSSSLIISEVWFFLNITNFECLHNSSIPQDFQVKLLIAPSRWCHFPSVHPNCFLACTKRWLSMYHYRKLFCMLRALLSL